MKLLYYGGQKSGKSLLAERKALSLADHEKPLYLATYDNSYGDTEMASRIALHRQQRRQKFITIEETHYLSRHIPQGAVCLIDCMSMWLLNTIEWELDSVLEEVEALGALDATLIFVLNDVSTGVIPTDMLSRRYVDRSGIVGQRLAQICDEVYEVTLGLPRRLK